MKQVLTHVNNYNLSLEAQYLNRKTLLKVSITENSKLLASNMSDLLE